MAWDIMEYPGIVWNIIQYHGMGYHGIACRIAYNIMAWNIVE
jgi:hypothetical protein